VSDLELFDSRVRKSAVLSLCQTYRYELRRSWADGPTVGFIMLNPSTADANEDDPTIRRCISFAKSWGYAGLVVRNLYALRATDPTELKGHPDPVGPDNRMYLTEAAADALTVCAWGANADPVDAQALVSDLIVWGVKPHHLGLTKAGFPKHPLYLRADTTPTPFSVAVGEDTPQ
jgi:hypothetical protein